MPTAIATIPTDRAGRYLTQLCRHLGQMSRMRHPTRPRTQAPPAVHDVDYSDTAGTIRFTHGTCTLHATPGALMFRVDADDEDALSRLQEGLARRLETVGRRDRLTVQWVRLDTESDVPAETPATRSLAPTGRPTRRPRKIGRALVLVTLAVLAIVVHVGLLGGAVAASPWANWGTNIVLVIILLKVVAIGTHAVLGRAAFRHRGALRHRRHKPTEAPARAHPQEHAS